MIAVLHVIPDRTGANEITQYDNTVICDHNKKKQLSILDGFACGILCKSLKVKLSCGGLSHGLQTC